jgi:hypothetical protein
VSGVRPSRKWARCAFGGALACATALSATGVRAQPQPLLPGEEVRMRITYAHLLAGYASLRVAAAEHEQRAVLEFVSEARSAGFFAWLLRFRVRDLTVATWDPARGCSLRIEKHLREGRAARDQVVTFDPRSDWATVEDPKIQQTRFEVGPCALDVLSAFFVTRLRGVSEDAPLSLPVFDNGKRYTLAVRFLGREKLSLPAPFGRDTPTVVVEPLLAEGSGLFVKRGRLKIWLTDDERRVPVRMRAKVAVGSVSADLESYVAGQAEATP